MLQLLLLLVNLCYSCCYCCCYQYLTTAIIAVLMIVNIDVLASFFIITLLATVPVAVTVDVLNIMTRF